MDLRNLNTFIHVAEMHSFTHAAEALGYTQPTVSFQIRQLEKELGAQLFERIGHTVQLTDTGRDALSWAQQICRMSSEMLRGKDEARRPSGVIRLATADSLCAPLILQHFARFREAYPEVSLRVTTAGTGELFRLLDHNEVDLVCTLDRHIYDANHVIASEEKIGVHFVAAPGHPLAQRKDIAVQDLAGEAFLLTENNMSYSRLLHEHMAQRNLQIRPVLELGSPQMIAELVAEGAGISFLPDFITEGAVQAGRLVRLDVKDVQIHVWKQLIHHREKWMSLQLKAAIDHLGGITLMEHNRA